jgi:hypothetical protein
VSDRDGPVRPFVVIGTSGPEPSGIVRAVQAGLEEEGVPFDVHRYEQTDPCALAHQAARDSPLDVGLGVTGEELCVHHAKLPRDRPVRSERTGRPAEARRLGHDAARVVTGVPLKPSDTSPGTDPSAGGP